MIADFDGDGKLDFATADLPDRQRHPLFWATGTARFSRAARLLHWRESGGRSLPEIRSTTMASAIFAVANSVLSGAWFLFS